ncbi:MAG: hypothetical protein LBI15_12380 [Dysgonamonadaceae bacterium]|nr:hypothetical protein [Dysgonamonadaceae bacterium]
MNAKKTYTFRIEPQDIDFRRRVSLVSMTSFILMTAGKNADENGFGLLDLQSDNYTWVLSRLVVDMQRFPTENDTMCIETWIENVGTTFTTRNFRITDGKGEIMGYATSSWAIIDMKTRRPLPLDTLPGLQQFVVPQSTPLGEPTRIPEVKGVVANTFDVKYSHLDVNKHANSLYYIQWISDCFPLDFYLKNVPQRLELNFLKEIGFQDEGEVYQQINGDNDYSFQIETRDKGVSCRARIVFKETTEFFVC